MHRATPTSGRPLPSSKRGWKPGSRCLRPCRSTSREGSSSILPGQTVLLTLDFEAGYTYQIEDFSGDEPIRTLVVVSKL